MITGVNAAEPHDRCEQRPRLIPTQRMVRIRDESNSTGLVTMSTSSGLKRDLRVGQGFLRDWNPEQRELITSRSLAFQRVPWESLSSRSFCNWASGAAMHRKIARQSRWNLRRVSDRSLRVSLVRTISDRTTALGNSSCVTAVEGSPGP
jgi:hypothetical protein